MCGGGSKAEVHKDGRRERRGADRGGEGGLDFPTKPINKKVGKVGGVIHIAAVLYVQYTGKMRKERREDNNDCDADADKRTRTATAAAAAAAAHPSSSNYDIDNSSLEREAEAVFPMHPAQPPPLRSPFCKRPRPVVRG